MSSTLLFDAASSSTTSSARPSRMASHDGQRSHGWPSRRSVQLTAFARIRAIEVLPVPTRTDEEEAVAEASQADGVAEGLDDRVLADDLVERLRAEAPIEGPRRIGAWRRGRRGARLGHRSPGRPGRWSCRAPSVDHRRSWARRSDQLGPGRSAAPGEQRLTLLPSGPDVVHASPLRGTRSSTPIAPLASANAGLGRGFSPAGADCRYRAPLVPRLARHRP